MRTAPRSGPATSTAARTASAHVVGVHQQRRAAAERGDLRGEGVPLGVVQQGEGVGAGADGGDAVAEAGRQVRGGGEAADVGGAGRGDGRQLVGAARAHLDQRAPAGRHRHPGRGRGDRRVVVEDREDHRLQQHALGEAALDPQHGRAGEVHLALRVAPDVAAEAVSRRASSSVGSSTTPLLAEEVQHDGRRSGSSPRRPGPGRCRRRPRSGAPRAAAG